MKTTLTTTCSHGPGLSQCYARIQQLAAREHVTTPCLLPQQAPFHQRNFCSAARSSSMCTSDDVSPRSPLQFALRLDSESKSLFCLQEISTDVLSSFSSTSRNQQLFLYLRETVYGVFSSTGAQIHQWFSSVHVGAEAEVFFFLQPPLKSWAIATGLF